MIYLVVWPSGGRFTYLDEKSARKNMLPGDKLYLIDLTLTKDLT